MKPVLLTLSTEKGRYGSDQSSMSPADHIARLQVPWALFSSKWFICLYSEVLHTLHNITLLYCTVLCCTRRCCPWRRCSGSGTSSSTRAARSVELSTNIHKVSLPSLLCNLKTTEASVCAGAVPRGAGSAAAARGAAGGEDGVLRAGDRAQPRDEVSDQPPLPRLHAGGVWQHRQPAQGQGQQAQGNSLAFVHIYS